MRGISSGVADLRCSGCVRPEIYLTPWVDKDVREMLESGKYERKIIECDWTLNET